MERATQSDAWQHFLRVAAYIRDDPQFEPQQRARKLELAERLRAFAEAAASGGPLDRDLDALGAALCDPTWAHDIASPARVEHLRQWLASDEASLRRAVEASARAGEDPVAAFSEFACAAGEERAPGVVLFLGSLFAFAFDPCALPLVRPAWFLQLAHELGRDIAVSDSVVEQYMRHLEFARALEHDMRAAGVRVADMLDASSVLLLIAARGGPYSWRFQHVEPFERAPDRGRRSTPRFYLSVCACLGYDAPYLLEWVEFHRLVGVEHFFLYNNGDREAQRALLADYVEEGVVTLYDWPVFPPMLPAHNHCTQNHRHDSRWIAFIDSDEYVFSPTGAPLPEVLADYEGWPGVGVNWAAFGPSGHRSKPPGLVIESYTTRAKHSGFGLYAHNLIKSIVDPVRVVDWSHVHYCKYDRGVAVDENHYPILEVRGTTTFTSNSRFQVNHYVTRSVEEFEAKWVSRNPAQGQARRKLDIERVLAEERLSGRTEEAILQYVPAVRRALGRRESGERAPSHI